MSAVTVHIVDDDLSFLRAVSRLLEAAGHTVRPFSTATDFLRALTPDARGCVILDLQMPDLNGLELQDALARTDNPLPVIFLSGQGDVPSTVRAMRRGAEDFLTKLAPKEELLAAVQRALARDAGESQQRQKHKHTQSRVAALSSREREVLRLVARGLLNKQIGMELGISERTVKLHRTNLTRKLGITSVAELTRLADEVGLEQSPQSPKA